MKTKEFLTLLNEHPNKSLIFEYKEGQLVGQNYHITEVKNVTVDSVDCGAGTDFWKESIIQLWERPLEGERMEYMPAGKALEILDKVDRLKPMEKEVEVKFEYSNPKFHTAQLYVNEYVLFEDKLVMKLGVQKTDCKAREECGVPETLNTKAEACCTPNSGCC